MQQFMQYTSSHNLGELRGCIGQFPKIYVTNWDNLGCEVVNGLFSVAQWDAQSRMTQIGNVTTTEMQGHYHLDGVMSADANWDFCKRQISNAEDLKRFDNLIQAFSLLKPALSQEDSTIRLSLVENALKVCPDICCMGYFMKYECQAMRITDEDVNLGCGMETLKNKQKGDKMLRALKQAVKAGEAFADMINADSFCKGNFYSFLPMRFLVRSAYLLGKVAFFMGQVDVAEQTLKRCLALDIHDKLGARHLLLLTVVEKYKLGSPEVTKLLKNRFGEDQHKDDIFALWNYTRSLNLYVKGELQECKKHLRKAIKRNPHVPPVILGWELTMNTTHLMELFTHAEARDCNLKEWAETDGALALLEKLYCEVQGVRPLSSSRETMLLLIQGTRILEAKSNLKLGLEVFDKLISILQKSSACNSKALLARAYQRRALIKEYSKIKPNTILEDFNLAFDLYKNQQDTNNMKETLYERAMYKEVIFDWSGALEDYTYVFDNIGRFSVAAEGIKRAETALGRTKSVIPPSPTFPNENSAYNNIQQQCENMLRNTNIRGQPSIASYLKRCAECNIGGAKLSKCDGCNGKVVYCSKSCQKIAWKRIHKYTCSGSQSLIAPGTHIVLEGLKSKESLNGKSGKIISASEEKGRFLVQLDDMNNVNVKPKNLLPIVPGQRVCLQGIKSREVLNGQYGKIISALEGKGRFLIELEKTYGDVESQSQISVQPKNFSLVA